MCYIHKDMCKLHTTINSQNKIKNMILSIKKPYNTIIEKHLHCENSLFTGILEIILFKAILWNKWFVYLINPNFHILDFLKEKYMKKEENHYLLLYTMMKTAFFLISKL